MLNDPAPPWQFPEPGWRRLQRLQLLLGFLVPAVPLTILLLVVSARARFIGMALTLVVLVFFLIWRYREAASGRYAFALLDDGVLVRRGLWWQQELFVPRVRIQHTDIAQGPLARRLELAQLLLFTSGTKQQELVLEGLSPPRARDLRDQLLLRTKVAETTVVSSDVA